MLLILVCIEDMTHKKNNSLSIKETIDQSNHLHFVVGLLFSNWFRGLSRLHRVGKVIILNKAFYNNVMYFRIK